MVAGISKVGALKQTVEEVGADGSNRAFNLTWHDHLNLSSLVDVSEAIAEAALARDNSRGAHFREDFPETAGLLESRYTVVSGVNEQMQVTTRPVEFSIVKPGESLIEGEAGAPPVTANA